MSSGERQVREDNGDGMVAFAGGRKESKIIPDQFVLDALRLRLGYTSAKYLLQV